MPDYFARSVACMAASSIFTQKAAGGHGGWLLVDVTISIGFMAASIYNLWKWIRQ